MTARVEPLELARRRFTEAVNALTDPQPLWTDGAARWTPSLYRRLRGSLRGQPTRSGRRVPDSRPPCRTDVLGLLIDIDMSVAEWHQPGLSTVDKLHRLRDKAWTPEHCELLDGWRTQISKWILVAVELLGDGPPQVALRLPCPSCGRKHIHRPNSSGEVVRVWTLRVSEDGARCQGCDATWTQEQFPFLAKLLGCPELPVA